MKKQDHRPDVETATLVVRHLKLEATNQSVLVAAISEIDQIHGMDGISFDEKSEVLNLAYDTSRVSLDSVEAVLSKHGISVSHDWWTHLKEGYYRYVDENLNDNLSHKTLGCHKVPPGAGTQS
ncbi:MAG: cation transporter [Gammaproteobacteria bacterium]|nr:cation transporter [Gammaproteobacteria bacterium]